ncbi:hypothetical protein A3J23_03045 [Candidatus Peregrinibacteria bacterium RIFCSPLOWO2_02_FULL_48_14]|nr:MAG: hypothetical protein A2974_02340 [Candidatus Peregrinibacteria bacterium RIFCSPLOWO2_01_FULL_48_20]OGJ46471.1 MAG: hypothetical protein A3J23_03045 [Candidatus Peregrinibacteria bacterium RIFCSPLOWO2_02_FULL_48_14]
MAVEHSNTPEVKKTSEVEVAKESKPYVPMKERAETGMGDVKLAEREEEKSAEKALLTELMKDMDPSQRLQYVEKRTQTLQNGLKPVSGDGRELRKAEQTAEREALLGYVDVRLLDIAENLIGDHAAEKAQLEAIKTSLER